MTRLVHRFLRDDGGSSLIEYAAVAGMVSTAIIVVAGGLGFTLKTSYESVRILLQ
jgi:Flp pilus assembly pilin Flp